MATAYTRPGSAADNEIEAVSASESPAIGTSLRAIVAANEVGSSLRDKLAQPKYLTNN